MLVVVIASVMAANVKGLPPCCHNDPVECQPITCPRPPCCHLPAKDMKP